MSSVVPFGFSILPVTKKWKNGARDAIVKHLMPNITDIVMEYLDCGVDMFKHNCQDCGLSAFANRKYCIICRAKKHYGVNYDTYIERCAARIQAFLMFTRSTLSETSIFSSERYVDKLYCVDKNGNDVHAKYIQWYGALFLSNDRGRTCARIGIETSNSNLSGMESGNEYNQRKLNWMTTPCDKYDILNRKEADYMITNGKIPHKSYNKDHDAILIQKELDMSDFDFSVPDISINKSRFSSIISNPPPLVSFQLLTHQSEIFPSQLKIPLSSQRLTLSPPLPIQGEILPIKLGSQPPMIDFERLANSDSPLDAYLHTLQNANYVTVRID